MASSNIARLGVVLACDTAEFTASINKAIEENNKLKRSIQRDSDAAAKEIIALKYATEDYGKEVSKVVQIEREIAAGRFQNATDPFKQKLREMAKSYDEVAMAQKKVSNGLSEQQKMALTYQATDLVTQLASGQNAMIALLQQGGQLKDQMGGFGKMFQVLGTFITPFNVALATAVATIGALSVAFYKGAQDAAKFRDDLILTNNYAKVTADSFQRMAGTISKDLNVSIGNTKDVLSELVSSGEFTNQSIDSVAKAILNVSKLTGDSAKETAQKLIPSFDGTASSAKRLNDKYHFLTLAQYKQIELLEKQGKLQEAAKITADALNTSLEGQARPLGALESNWTKLRNAASEAWDAMTGGGKAKTLEDELAVVNKTIDYYKNKMSKGGLGSNDSNNAKRLKDEQDRAAAIQEQIQLRNRALQKKDETERINDYAKNEQKRIDISLDAEKTRIQNKYQFESRNADEINKFKFEADEKLEILELELKRKNEQEKGVFAKQNAEKFAEDQLKILRDLDIKVRDLNRKREAESRTAHEEWQKQRDEEEAAVAAAYDAQLKAIRDKGDADDLSLQRQRQNLELEQKSLFYTEAQAKAARIDLEYQQKIDEIKKSSLSESDKQAYITRLLGQRDLEKTLSAGADSLARMKEMSDSVWNNMSQALETFVRTGKLSFKDLTRSILQDLLLIQMKAQAMAIFKFIGGLLFPDAGASTTTGSITGPGLKISQRASGGPVYGNQPYLVGERGPELFMPSSAGTIIPNSQMGGGVTNVTNNYINAIDTKSFEQRLMASPNAVWAANSYAQKSLAVGRGRA